MWIPNHSNPLGSKQIFPILRNSGRPNSEDSKHTYWQMQAANTNYSNVDANASGGGHRRAESHEQRNCGTADLSNRSREKYQQINSYSYSSAGARAQPEEWSTTSNYTNSIHTKPTPMPVSMSRNSSSNSNGNSNSNNNGNGNDRSPFKPPGYNQYYMHTA